jgi:hypothetical protein
MTETIETELTWEMLCHIEPRLLSLLNEIQKSRNKKMKWYQVDEVWYGRFKPLMESLVGVYADGDEIISSSRAYNIAYKKLYDALRGKA